MNIQLSDIAYLYYTGTAAPKRCVQKCKKNGSQFLYSFDQYFQEKITDPDGENV